MKVLNDIFKIVYSQKKKKCLNYHCFTILQIYHNKEPYNLPEDHFLNDTRSDYQPFPKLERVFKEINTNIGFNIELKWTMKLQVNI